MKRSEVMTSAAAVLVREDEGLSVRWGPAGVVRIVAGAASTDGSFSICEVTEPPGSAAPLHVHHGEAEAFYLLEGEIELTCVRRIPRSSSSWWASTTWSCSRCRGTDVPYS